MVDIGGPTMVRASAEPSQRGNSVQSEDYSSIIEELKSGSVSLETEEALH